MENWYYLKKKIILIIISNIISCFNLVYCYRYIYVIHVTIFIYIYIYIYIEREREREREREKYAWMSRDFNSDSCAEMCNMSIYIYIHTYISNIIYSSWPDKFASVLHTSRYLQLAYLSPIPPLCACFKRNTKRFLAVVTLYFTIALNLHSWISFARWWTRGAYRSSLLLSSIIK